MKRIVIFCALCALWGCRQANVSQTEPIALYYSIAEQSKTDLLTQGEEIGVFAAVAGTERYFLDNTKYIVEADGRSLSTAPAVYYPEAKQAVTFTAYLPFGGAWDGGLGTFSVPSDQTTTLALKEADLCWATASSTPVAAPVALEFRHQMARLLITTNEPTEKIAIPNAFSGGTLDIKTGAFTNTLKSEVLTTGTELILPAQTVTRLVLTVSGVDYTFEGAIALEAAKTTSINLTFHPATKTATLSGSSTTDWTGSSSQGNPTQSVSNILTIHWPTDQSPSSTPDKVTLTIDNTDYTVSSGIAYADQTFTVPFASSVLRYPYTITKVAFTNLSPFTQLLGATIYKSGRSTIGINDPAGVLINNVIWATGNLVASNSTAGAAGVGGCKIGAPGDHGLYFQFGSLIGWKGGALANGGTGVGSNPYTGGGSQWWGGGGNPGFNIFSNDAMVWPSEMTKTPTSWPNNNGSSAGDRNTVVDQWFFNYNVAPYSTTSQDIRGFSGSFTGDLGSGTLGTGRYAKWGVGDPCTYYLGGTWRLPTTTEQASITGKTGSGWIAWTTAGLTARWATSIQTFDGVSGPGVWFGAPLSAGSGTPNTSVNPFFPASGLRHPLNDGAYYHLAVYSLHWSSSVYNATDGYDLHSQESGGVIPQAGVQRSHGYPVRCVGSVP